MLFYLFYCSIWVEPGASTEANYDDAKQEDNKSQTETKVQTESTPTPQSESTPKPQSESTLKPQSESTPKVQHERETNTEIKTAKTLIRARDIELSGSFEKLYHQTTFLGEFT